jgi:hypothetical protein
MQAALSAIGGKSVAPAVEAGVAAEPALAPASDETRKRCALHSSLCTAYACFEFPTAMLPEHATAAFA